jgi:hypothetical protein
MSAVDDEVFVYTGAGGAEVPDDVIRVRVDPSVTSIPPRAFYERKKLAEVELCEGLVEIGKDSFSWCDHSITKINIPNSLKRINDYAFACSLRCSIRLHDGIESIEEYAFGACHFTNFRVPPIITVIPERMLYCCMPTFSVELSESLREIRALAFCNCICLRNVAFPPDAVFSDNIFIREDVMDIHMDLQLLFGSEAEIIRELQHRFDVLPIHKLVYYLSYHQGVLQRLIAAINMRSGLSRTLRSKLDPTGNQQDCLGMTPLHILACSSVHDLELYRVIVERYPTNLITEDRWGATPLLYVFWGAAPAEIIEFVIYSYQLFYPGHVFNWTMMVETMGRCDTPKENIENMLWMKQLHFPEQPIDWEFLLDQFAYSSQSSFYLTFKERMRFLVMCGMSERVEALAIKVWRDCITNMIHTADYKHKEDNRSILHRIQIRITHFQSEVSKLKEATTILELALWKLRMNEKIPQEEGSHCQKKIKTDESSIRRQCRITCGADVVIRHVLPYLVTVAVEESDSDSDSNASSDDWSSNSFYS